MGWAMLSDPGSSLGPCAEPCAHRDCADTREIAASPCSECNDEIGYRRAFYQNTDGSHVHATCEERRIARIKNDGIVRLIKPHKRGSGTTEIGASRVGGSNIIYSIGENASSSRFHINFLGDGDNRYIMTGSRAAMRAFCESVLDAMARSPHADGIDPICETCGKPIKRDYPLGMGHEKQADGSYIFHHQHLCPDN